MQPALSVPHQGHYVSIHSIQGERREQGVCVGVYGPGDKVLIADNVEQFGLFDAHAAELPRRSHGRLWTKEKESSC